MKKILAQIDFKMFEGREVLYNGASKNADFDKKAFKKQLSSVENDEMCVYIFI